MYDRARRRAHAWLPCATALVRPLRVLGIGSVNHRIRAQGAVRCGNLRPRLALARQGGLTAARRVRIAPPPPPAITRSCRAWAHGRRTQLGRGGSARVPVDAPALHPAVSVCPHLSRARTGTEGGGRAVRRRGRASAGRCAMGAPFA